MAFPSRALLDPLPDGGDLGIRQGYASLRRRHSRGWAGGADAGEEAAFRRVAGHDNLITAPIGEEPVFGIEPQVGHAAFVVGAVTGEAVVGENGAHVAIEIDGLFGAEAETGSTDGEKQTNDQITLHADTIVNHVPAPGAPGEATKFLLR